MSTKNKIHPSANVKQIYFEEVTNTGDILKRIKEIVDNEKITSIEVRLMIKDILERNDENV